MAGYVMLGIFGAVIVVMAWAMNSRVAGERGWVYNRFNPRPKGAGSLGLLEAIYHPAIEHLIEERASERARGSQDESGDPPDAGDV